MVAQSFQDLSASPQQLLRILIRLGLAEPDETPVITPLTGGVSSGILHVALRKGSVCVKQALPQLKVDKVWKVPLERALYEVDWLRTVGAICPGHVPEVLGQDQETTSFVMNFFDQGHRSWKAELLEGRVDPAVGRQVGDILGRIHARTAHDGEIARRFATDDNFHAIRLEPYLVETGRVHGHLRQTMQALVERTQANRRVLVHGDVSPKNILLGPQGPVFLDAECAWYGDPAFDVAFCLNHLLIKMLRRPADANALAATFLCLRDAYMAHVAFEPVADLEQRTASLLPALALARVDGKSPVEYLDGAQRERLRALAMTLTEHPPLTLEALAQQWKNEVQA